MDVLDLRTIRCPLALVTLKLTLKSESTSINDDKSRSLKLLFSTKQAMSEIMLYLDKKSYHYQLSKNDNQCSLIIIINP